MDTEEPIGPPLTVLRTVTTTPGGVVVEALLPAEHPAYAAVTAGLLRGCTVEVP